MSNQPPGIYGKYKVERTDGRSAPGQKHHECAYFVLDLACDDYAEPALRAYAKACRQKLPELAADIETILDTHPCGCREAMCPHVGFFGREPQTPSEQAHQLMAHTDKLRSGSTELEALRAIVATMQLCHGESCKRIATWRQKFTHLCDEHVRPHSRRAIDGSVIGSDPEPYWELSYAPGVRLLERADR